MKRRHFIKTASLSGIAIATIPQWAFTQNLISVEELIGKGNPILFGDTYKLQEEAHLALLKMKKEALKENIAIQVVSSYRNFDHQKRIWERKFERYRNQGLSEENTIKKIIEYSTIPGTSRHHWGTDIDIVDGNVHPPKNMLRAVHFHRDGEYIYLRRWLEKHASRFGFYLVYNDDSKRKGFKYEPWHYSYKPLSQPYLQSYRNLNLKEILQNEKLSGHSQFTEALLNTYLNENILDINLELL
jgi:LAS superfamily LD-carboxypeptidase LdcB